MTLTREQILASRADRKPVPLDVPEWGGQVYVRVMSARDQAALADDTTPGEMPVRILLLSIVDEEGNRIFTEEDFPALMDEDFPVIMRVFAFTAKLNGLSTDELEAAMASFAPTPDAFSSSA